MKKFRKIFGITIGTLLGVVLLVIGAAIYVVFTPKRLTPIVRDIANQYVSCEHEIGEVELTFFSTFPDFGLRIDGLYLIHPMEGAQSDTLLAAKEAVVVVNPIRFLKEQTLDVRQITLNNTSANIFTNENGISNLDVFVFPADTVAEEDTTGFSLPFEQLNIDLMSAQVRDLTYISLQDSIDVQVRNLQVTANAPSWEDINVKLLIDSLSAAIGNEAYAKDLQCSITLNHLGCRPDSMAFTVQDATIRLNDFTLRAAGNADLQQDIAVNLDIESNEWDIPELLRLLPHSISDMLDGIEIGSGKMFAKAHVEGIYNDSVFPVADADLQLIEGAGSYKAILPYDLKSIELLANAHIDLNDDKSSKVSIRQLKAATKETTIEANGEISELMADMLCDLHLKTSLYLPDIMPLLPQEMQAQTEAKGRMQGSISAKIRLSDLMNMNLQKGNVRGNIHCQPLTVTYDSLYLSTPAMQLTFQIPNKASERKQTNWLKAHVTTDNLSFSTSGLEAATGKNMMEIETSDIFSGSPVIYAACALKSEQIVAAGDSMAAHIVQPDLDLYAEYDTKDTAQIPAVDATLNFQDLNGSYADYQAHLTQSAVTAKLSGSKRDKLQPRLRLNLTTDALAARSGEDMQIETQQISLTANARYNAKYDNLLLQWNPKINVKLSEGIVNMAAFKETILIPAIDFDYSNKVCHISDSRIIIGNSDFSLTGEVDGIGKWLKDEDILRGELNFVSEHTDVNELMLLTSSDTGSEENATETSVAATDSTEESQPYLVPKNVDLTLNTLIKKAEVFDQTATNLGGKLYVKDGILVLEEMGFICNAARLQLTAMYKTPRRNHLYLGLDYHMLDINIKELVNMIPQIDSMVPMLRSFQGNAEFHLAAETYLNSKYELKTSTTRGACSISGKDLVLLDNETFGKIAKILMFSKKTENKVDSISAEITLFKNEIDIYPFCLSIDNYMAAVGGRHNLDMTFDYHISLLKPLYIGVDVRGTFDDLKIRPTKCRYAKDFRPIIRRETETQNNMLRKKIKESLQKNVKE
ncbi:MAG: hypothetical protein ACI3Z5_02585 [Paludibacteraceae bacterium]